MGHNKWYYYDVVHTVLVVAVMLYINYLLYGLPSAYVMYRLATDK